MKPLTYDINQFHPTLRESAGGMFDIINTRIHPFGPGTATLKCVREYPGEKRNGQPNGKMKTFTPDESYGFSHIDNVSTDKIIYLNGIFYDQNADLPLLQQYKDANKKTFMHGNMMTVGADIAHEYGHCFEAMVHFSFFENEDLDVGGRVTTAYKAVIEMAQNIMKKADPIEIVMMKVLDLPYKGELVSGYATDNDREYFAETFSAVLCDHQQHDKKTVVAMKHLIDVTYDQIALVGPDKVDAAESPNLRHVRDEWKIMKPLYDLMPAE